MSEILNEDSLIKVNNVSFSYASKQIYKNLSLNIPKGKITAILGPSGTGKTTILRLIGAQLVPDEGTIEFDGINVHSLKRNELYELRKRMSMLFQSGALFSDMNVFDNVAFPIREHTALPEELIHDVVLMNLEAVGMRAAAYLYPSELSGGMARRAALARSIALDPDLIAALIAGLRMAFIGAAVGNLATAYSNAGVCRVIEKNVTRPNVVTGR